MGRRWVLVSFLCSAAVAAGGFPASCGAPRRFAGTARAAEPAAGADETRSAKALSRAFSTAAKKACPAVVHIEAVRKAKGRVLAPNDPFDLFNDDFFKRFFGPGGRPKIRPGPQEPFGRGQGSGVIVDQKGYILTNNHVVGGADEIKVKLADKREFEAKLVGADDRSDVAVIKIDGKDLPAAAVGDSDALEVGEWVLAIGNPFGLDQTVTAGVISAKGRSHVVDIQYQDFIQTDAAINPGNSGGPLIDLDGRVVGINTAIFSKSGGYMGIGFAIPINMAQKIMKNLIDTGKVVRGWMGVAIQDVETDLAKALGLPEAKGALVAEVVKGSPAAKAGLEERDVVVSFGGKKIEDANSLSNAVSLAPVGKEVEVEFYRSGKKRSVTVKIGERTPAVEVAAGNVRQLEKLGVTAQELDEGTRLHFDLGEGVSGVVVTEVEAGSLADKAGLKPGMIIQEVGEKPIASIADLQGALAVADKRVLVKVRADGRPSYLALKLE